MPDQPEQRDHPDQPGQAPPALSVGELIRAAERESERLLATAGPADALALIRGWPDVLPAMCKPVSATTRPTALPESVRVVAVSQEGEPGDGTRGAFVRGWSAASGEPLVQAFNDELVLDRGHGCPVGR